MHTLVEILRSPLSDVRNTPLEAACAGRDAAQLLVACTALEECWRASDSLYERVRALLFLHAIHRFELPARPGFPAMGRIPVEGHEHLLERRFAAAIGAFLEAQRTDGPSEALSSALAEAYRGLAFQTLADQVQRSVRAAEGNAWMFAVEDLDSAPLTVRDELRDGRQLVERTPVRLDLSHSAWSDIFFLAMDYPEAARVLNLSIDLAVRGRDSQPRPPITCTVELTDQPHLVLESVDLDARAEISDLATVFDFARDYLGLLKAAVIAAGVVPPGLEGSAVSLPALLRRLCGPGRGLRIRSHVHGIPKGSRLAVSTNLLASLIALLMRATGQTQALTGSLPEAERRQVAARAILGEWLGGSGGGWQDSGGVWPGVKRIEGRLAAAGDPEAGVSRGRLLPDHHILGDDDLAPGAMQALQQSLVLIHGGLAQNVGPVLEIVTEKYLLRSAHAWRCRQRAVELFDQIAAALQRGDVRRLAALTTDHFHGPIQGIIPAATNHLTERLLAEVERRFGADYWGFCMLGGMSGGGMGLWFAPYARARALEQLPDVLAGLEVELGTAMPFAMHPVVYDFAINPTGTAAELREAPPPATPEPDAAAPAAAATPRPAELDALLAASGFDRRLHEDVRRDLLDDRIGLTHNRLPACSEIVDAADDDVGDALEPLPSSLFEAGCEALAAGRVAVVTLAAGAGSRWTQGAGVVKALHPFARFQGRHRSFLEVHLAKSSRTQQAFGGAVPHVFTTSLFTHDAIADHLARHDDHGYRGPLRLSPGRAVGLRMVPMARDLDSLWQETAQQKLDAQAQKVRESAQAAWLDWARQTGEAADYVDNLAPQCLHPVGHWFEVPNLLRNGVLHELLMLRPRLDTLLLHNIDTLGASLDPALLGLHLASGKGLSFEVVPRRVEDRGGGLARVDGRLRLIESLALPRPNDELRLSFYNSMTTWIDVDALLAAFGLGRDDLADQARVDRAVHDLSARLPTYVTIKEVKKRWGHGHEDVFPVSQFEKLWSDITCLDVVGCQFVAVPRARGQQLKDPAQLDGWLRDGSAATVEALCAFDALR